MDLSESALALDRISCSDLSCSILPISETISSVNAGPKSERSSSAGSRYSPKKPRKLTVGSCKDNDSSRNCVADVRVVKPLSVIFGATSRNRLKIRQGCNKCQVVIG